MKRKEFNDLRQKDIKALRSMATARRFEISKKRMEVMGGKEKNLKATNNMRHDLAQILTVIREKEIIEKLQPKVVEAKEEKK